MRVAIDRANDGAGQQALKAKASRGSFIASECERFAIAVEGRKERGPKVELSALAHRVDPADAVGAPRVDPADTNRAFVMPERDVGATS